VTTDAPGCRQTIIPGENGFLVPVMDDAALAEAMERFLVNPDLVTSMGTRSRQIAQEVFDVGLVNAAMIAAMRLE
jgi:glycosyltransferase involved in cell wall biosynthesis